MKLNTGLMADLQNIVKEKQGYIAQFQAHYVLQKRWGFKKLARITKNILDEERDHLKAVVHYIAQRDGTPQTGQHDEVSIGTDVPTQIQNDLENEEHCVEFLNKVISSSRTANEDSMRRLVEHIVKDDEKHVAKLEKQKRLIAMLGMQGYLHKVSKA